MANTNTASSSTRPTIFFLGATGGSTLTVLIKTFNAGYPCIALVRTPSKLTNLLKDNGVSDSTLASLLTVHTGNAVDVSSVKQALLIESGDTPRLPDTIISGLGSVLKTQFSLQPFTTDQPTICQDAASTLTTALSEIYTTHPHLQESKPLFCFISTGGMNRGQDDIPWLIQLLYSTILRVPHQDKMAMDKIFFGEEGRSNFRNLVAVKPTMLTEGPELGDDKMRVGRKGSPAVGYSVSRKDVGGWIYRSVVLGSGNGWEDEMVTVTY